MTRIALPRTPEPIDPQAVRQALEDVLSGDVRFDRVSRALYSSDASVYQIVPLGVVLPKHEQDVLETLAVCTRFSVPITSRGGGTSQAGQCIGPGIVLDFSRYFDRVLEINAEEKWARVEPGVVLDDLNRQVKPFGLQFAPDISTSNRATIGGMIANNSSGTHSVIYGKTIDHVLGLRVVLPDGSIIRTGRLSDDELAGRCGQADLEGACYRTVRRLAQTHAAEIQRRFPKILRRVGGYNLDRFLASGGRKPPDDGRMSHQGANAPCSPINLSDIFVGSEGTLGITLEATVKLIDLPKSRCLMVIHFPELLAALEATPWILDHQPAAIEVIDRFILDSTKLNPEASRLRDFLIGDPGAILLVEFYADRAEDLLNKLDALERDLRGRGVSGPMVRALDQSQQDRIWKLRKLALGLSMAEKGDAKAISFVEDTAVAPEHLRDYIAEFLERIRAHHTTAGVYAHASVGCLHVRPVINLKTEEGVRHFESLASEVAELVLKYGGALSGEHGDGLVRSPFMEKMFGPTLYQAFRELKRFFDPRNLFNPGKIVDAAPLVDNLRLGPSYATPEVATTFDFSVEGGLARAVELCAGVGECRKKRQGVMCPSYQATCEEQHSTRGRANVLRLALTGQLGLQGLTDGAVKDALDLCLECKACKSECPTNVDMARLKAEFLHQYHKKHGLPWRNWIFGHVDSWYRRGSAMPRVFNALTRSTFGRWLNQILFGIDRRRMPPALARQAWKRTQLSDIFRDEVGFLGHGGGDRQSPSRQVFLFPDTFLNFVEPELGHQMLRLLSALDCGSVDGVHEEEEPYDPNSLYYTFSRSEELTCCGRPFISNGMLDHAVTAARQNIEWLHPWAEQSKPIIACEPSCILTIKDDYPALLRGEWQEKARIVAKACRTFEEFALELWTDAGTALVDSARLPKKILALAHCHQRSLVGVQPLLNLLRRLPGVEVIDLDVGCCGLAGSFGYETEHYEISRLVGEQRLFPALRKMMGPDTVVVAPGFSCRSQIAHFTGIRAVHPVQLFAAILKSNGSAAVPRSPEASG